MENFNTKTIKFLDWFRQNFITKFIGFIFQPILFVIEAWIYRKHWLGNIVESLVDSDICWDWIVANNFDISLTSFYIENRGIPSNNAKYEYIDNKKVINQRLNDDFYQVFMEKLRAADLVFVEKYIDITSDVYPNQNIFDSEGTKSKWLFDIYFNYYRTSILFARAKYTVLWLLLVAVSVITFLYLK